MLEDAHVYSAALFDFPSFGMEQQMGRLHFGEEVFDSDFLFQVEDRLFKRQKKKLSHRERES